MRRILEPYMSNLHKRQVYAGLMEIVKDSKYYYHSKVGADYCHFTDDGKKALMDYIEHMAPLMIKREKEELEALAKQMMWEELKK